MPDLTPADLDALRFRLADRISGWPGGITRTEVAALLDALDQSRAEALAYADRIAELTCERNEAQEGCGKLADALDGWTHDFDVTIRPDVIRAAIARRIGEVGT